MKKLALFLLCFQLTLPAGAEANSMASGLSTLKDLDDQLEQATMEGYEESEEFGEAEEKAELTGGDVVAGEELDLPEANASLYCENPNTPPAYVWLAKSKKKSKKKGRRNCGCSSGCGMIKAGLKPVIKKFVAAAEKAGIPPVSCIRTQTCQNRLRSCYERCGQRGRAAKKSKHSDGRACDFSKKNASRLTKLKKQTGLPIKRLTHGREGGGLHEYQ